MPWLPSLIDTLRTNVPDLAPLLTREAARIFPPRLPDLDAWTPPWQAPAATATRRPATPPSPLLTEHPHTTIALANLLGYQPTPTLLTHHPETATALAGLLAKR